MRPSFAYVDADTDDAHVDDRGQSATAPAPKLQAVSIKRAPTSREVAIQRTSYAFKRQEQDAEPWHELAIAHREHSGRRRDALKAHGEAPVDDEAEAPVELPELPVQDDDARDARDEVVAWVRAHAVSGTSNTIKEIYAAVADRFGVELTKPWKMLIKRVAPGDDIDAYDDDDDDAYEEDASVEAPDERGVSGESGDDDDDDDGLKIYDDCDDDDDAPFDEPDLEPKPKHKQTRDDSVPWRTTKTWTGGTCKWEKKLKCPCKVRIVHPADQPGVTYFQERLGHVHNFDDEMKTSTTLPVKIREIVAPRAPKPKIPPCCCKLKNAH
ncbi:hypothetical protein JL722_4048 [Aureococcus anophagefferens]|nr:hypothetical protein JL722_4048 [Aureococcus anophagefferens]